MFACATPQTAALERKGVASNSHSRDGTTAILLSIFSKKACTMFGDEELGRVYHAEFFAWYAQRVTEKIYPNLKSPAARELDRKKKFPKSTFGLKKASTKRSVS